MKKVDLLTVAKGAVPEMFGHELREVLANIHDPNTDPKKPRKITVEVTFTPDEDREMVATSAQVKSKLVPVRPAASIMWLGQDSDGHLVGSTVDPRQLDLLGGGDPDITPISRKEGNG